jgi:hypothetical protein
MAGRCERLKGRKRAEGMSYYYTTMMRDVSRD